MHAKFQMLPSVGGIGGFPNSLLFCYLVNQAKFQNPWATIDGTVSEQVKIAKKFKQNMRLKENLKKD